MIIKEPATVKQWNQDIVSYFRLCPYTGEPALIFSWIIGSFIKYKKTKKLGVPLVLSTKPLEASQPTTNEQPPMKAVIEKGVTPPKKK